MAFEHVAFYANGRVTWVEEIIVQPDLRGQGIGRALMQDIEGWADARGSRLVALATRRAAEFYKALGYAESAAQVRSSRRIHP